MLNLTASPHDDELAMKIVRRVKMLTGEKLSLAFAATSLIACHLNACPLDMERMLDHGGDPLQAYDVLSDLLGIQRHFDRRVGALTLGWKPRFAARQTEASKEA